MNETKEKSGLPEGWKWVVSSEILDIRDGTHDTPKYVSENGVPLITSKNLKENKIDFEKISYISVEDHAEISKRSKVEEGDILFAMIGTIGNPAVIKGNVNFSIKNVGLFKRNEKEIEPSYLVNFLRSCTFEKQLNERKLLKGTTQKFIPLGNLRKIHIPLPPKPIQQAIVSKIEELFSELDKGIETLRLAQQQLKTYRQAVLKWAFEGKLTEEWREQQKNLISGDEILAQILFEKNRIADAQKKKTKELCRLNDEELEELFTIPKEWVWAKNETYLFEVKDGTHDTPKYLEKGIPFITQKNIREQGLKFTDTQFISQDDHQKFYQRSNVTKGDILISMIGHNRGMTAIVDTDNIFSIKNVGLFKFLPNYQSNKFSFYYYQSKVGLHLVLQKSKGGAQPFIGLTELRNWPVVVCSLEEQKQIVQEIESRLSVVDKMEESIMQSLL